LFGSQLTAANMEMQQLKVDLDFQRQEMEGNWKNASESIKDLKKAVAITDESIENSKKAKGELEEFVDTFINGAEDDGPRFGNGEKVPDALIVTTLPRPTPTYINK